MAAVIFGMNSFTDHRELEVDVVLLRPLTAKVARASSLSFRNW